MNTVQDEEAILAQLRNLTASHIAVNPAALELGARLVDIGIDSFALIELVFVAEEEFGIKIPMEELHPITVGDVVAVIAKGVAAQYQN